MRAVGVRMSDRPEPRPEEARLIMPDPAYGADYIAALREGYLDGSEAEVNDDARIAAIAADLPAHLATLNAQGGTMLVTGGREIPKVPFAQFWMVTEGWFIGRVGIRYGLNEGLRLWGGHIGYEIRPRLRRRGFGRQALALGIAHCRAQGLGRLLLTCADDNAGSARIIESHGGVLEGKGPHPLHPGMLTRRYWIEA
jgi:predicted acetyltransferase